MSNIALGLYKYVNGVNDTPFPSSANQAFLVDWQYGAKRMGGTPVITGGTINHSTCLDGIWDDSIYVMYNGERYFPRHAPTSSYSNTDSVYKHQVDFVSERFILDNIYFYDVIPQELEDESSKPISNNANFTFFGTLKEFVARLNVALNQRGNTNYTCVIDDTEAEPVNAEKRIKFDNKFISEAMQESFKVWGVPYYFVGRVIHYGDYNPSALDNVIFEYGMDKSLLSITKTNANTRVVNRITGLGSKDNIPYYYPNSCEEGVVDVDNIESSTITAIDVIDDSLFAKKIPRGDTLTYSENARFAIDIPSFYVGDESYGNGQKIEVARALDNLSLNIPFEVPFNNVSDFTIKIDVDEQWYAHHSNTPVITPTPSGNMTYEQQGDTFLIHLASISKGEYQLKIAFNISTSQYIAFDISADGETQAWKSYTTENVFQDLTDIGLRLQGSASNGDNFQQIISRVISPQSTLMPPIYRETGGDERFYNAVNNTYLNPETGEYYEFPRPYTIDSKAKEYIHTFDDIKPSIKGVANSEGESIDRVIKFAFDENDSDEMDEQGNYLHPYFFALLPKMDGAFGFNLFDQAIDEDEMSLSFTQGNLGACEFKIGVGQETNKNIVQIEIDSTTKQPIYDEDGHPILVRNDNGDVKRSGTPQSWQNDTFNNEVWVALRKDDTTYGIIMPNATSNYRPNDDDDNTFVILHINLPIAYIRAAENALKEALISYMWESNKEHWNFSINFSRIYLQNNPTILQSLNENAKLSIRYNGEVYERYVSSYTYKTSANEILPAISVELAETLSVSSNPIDNAISGVRDEIDLINSQRVDYSTIARLARGALPKDNVNNAGDKNRPIYFKESVAEEITGIDVPDDIHSDSNIHADGGVAAKGISDLSIGAGGGGTATSVIFDSNEEYQEVQPYIAQSGVIHLPSYPSITGLARQSWVSQNFAVKGTENRVSAIEALIPAQATYQNQLADKAFVNSSVATATAEFQGTYDVVEDLGLTASATHAQIQNALLSAVASQQPDNNDYVFVSIPAIGSASGKYERYKYNGTAWAYEFTLNNSSFTAAQWDSINSGITSGKVSSYDSHLSNTSNPHGVTKAQVGLGNVENTKLSTWAGTSNITTLGTITTGVWHGTKIAKSYLADAVQTSLGLADTSIQGVKVNGTALTPSSGVVDVSVPTALSQLSADATHRLVTDSQISAWGAKYDKPSGGIPKSDLASAVQSSLASADSAVQIIWVNGSIVPADENHIVKITDMASATTLANHTGNTNNPHGVQLVVGTGSNATKIKTTNGNFITVPYATKAAQLYTSRTLWGQSFDGTQNVSGDMTGVGSITASGNIVTEANVMADGGMAAKGISDLSIGVGGGGTATSVSVNGTTYVAQSGVITIPDYPTWGTLSGKPTLATVATSGNYNDLSNKPSITARLQVSDTTNKKINTMESTGNYIQFVGGTNKFTVKDGTSQFDVAVTPSITNNVTGSGTSGYLAKFNGANTITNGPALGSDTTKFLRNDGSWVVPAGTYSLPLAANGTRGGVQIGYTTDAANRNYAVQLSSEKMYVNVPWENTHYTAVPILGGSSATSNATTATANNATYLNIIENGAKSGGVQITGSGLTSVSAKDGKLTISSAISASDVNTAYGFTLTGTAGTTYALATISSNASNGNTAYGYFSSGILKAENMSAANIKTALGYTPFDNASFTQANIKSTLGISDWALAASKPSYAFSEITGTASESQIPTLAISKISGLQTALDGKLATSLKGAANGLAELDANGLVPSSQLPSYVDDIVDLLNMTDTAPSTCVAGDKYYNTTSKKIYIATGTNTWGTNGKTPEGGKIYVNLTDNNTYRWSGSTMVEISPSLALGETSSTAYRGDRGAIAYSHATDASRLTTAKSSGFYKFATTAEGHIASVTAVTASDLTTLIGNTTYAPYHSGGYVTLNTEQTITGAKTFQGDNFGGILTVKRNAQGASLVTFRNSAGLLGHIGIYTDGVPKFWDSNNTSNTIWHAGNSNLSTVDWSVKKLTAAGQIVSNVAQGTAPLSVASTTMVTNLNAEYLGGTKKADLFSALTNDNEQVSATIGGTNKKLTIDYATKALRMKQESLTAQEFTFRNSPKTIDTDSVKFDRILGRTLAWNQLIPNGNFSDSSSWRCFRGTFTVANNQAVVTISSSDTGAQFYQEMAGIATHIYYQAFSVKASTSGKVSNRMGQSYLSVDVNSNNFVRTSRVYTCPTTGTNSLEANCQNVSLPANATFTVRDFVRFDLTLMFGAGNEPTLEEFEALYLPKYYAYNAGQLINNSAKAIECVGFNLWDEEWRDGYYTIEDGKWYASAQVKRACNKNPIRVLPNTDYYATIVDYSGTFDVFYYDINMNFLGYNTTRLGGAFTTPSNCCYINFGWFTTYGGVYKNDTCINLSKTTGSPKNGDYVPYKKVVTELNLQEIKVKSPNIWDEEWDNCYWDEGNGGVKVDYANAIGSNTHIEVNPNTTYYWTKPSGYGNILFYSKNKTYLSYVTTNSTSLSFTTPADCAYITFYEVLGAGATYQNNITINKSDPAFNGRYFPHGVLTFNGLKSAGNVCDEITNGGRTLIRRIEMIDLGSLTWSAASGNGVVYTTLPRRKYASSIGFMTNKYDTEACSGWDGVSLGKCEYYYSSSQNYTNIYVRDANHTTPPTSSDRWLDGVMLNYELANYETYELVEPIPMSMPSGTTERRLPADTEDIVIAPFVADMTYGTNNGDVLTDVLANRHLINYHAGKFVSGDKLLSNGIEVVNLSDVQALTNKTYNGLALTKQTTGFTIAGGTTSKTLTVNESYTLGAACAKGYTDSSSASAISTGTNLVTERDVYYGLPTINGAHNYTSGTTIYAPTGAGTSGQILKSTAGTPEWINQSAITAGDSDKVDGHHYSELVTSVGIDATNGKLTWAKGGTAQTSVNIVATKLTTVSKTAWGRTYWTSGGVPDNISGDMSSVGHIAMLNNKAIYIKDTSATDVNCMTLTDGNNFSIGYGAGVNGYNTNIFGQTISFYAGTTLAATIDNNKNLWVGGTTSMTGVAYHSESLVIDNDKAIYFKEKVSSGTARILNAVTLNQSNVMSFGYGAATYGMETWLNGDVIKFRTGTGNANAVAATIDADKNLSVLGDVVADGGMAAKGISDLSVAGGSHGEVTSIQFDTNTAYTTATPYTAQSGLVKLPAYPTWANLSGKPTLATVATTGNYNDLSNKPTSKAAVQGGTELSLVYTGDKWNWDRKSRLGVNSTSNRSSYTLRLDLDDPVYVTYPCTNSSYAALALALPSTLVQGVMSYLMIYNNSGTTMTITLPSNGTNAVIVAPDKTVTIKNGFYLEISYIYNGSHVIITWSDTLKAVN